MPCTPSVAKHAVSDLKLFEFSQEIHISNLTKWFHFRKNALSKWVANAKNESELIRPWCWIRTHSTFVANFWARLSLGGQT